jgi:hypothetical protein
MNEQIIELYRQIRELELKIKEISLLEDIWLELGPYTPHLSIDLRYRLQDHFKFDDSE